MLKAMVIRNLKLFFRDKAAVFFSLLGVLIIIFLYVLFLGTLVMDQTQIIFISRWYRVEFIWLRF